MTDLEQVKALLDKANSMYEVNAPEHSEPGLTTVVVNEKCAMAMFSFDDSGELVGFGVYT